MQKKKFTVEFPSKEDGEKYCEKKGIQSKNIREYEKDKVLCFSSRIQTKEAQILSNMYPCSLSIGWYRFNSVEQAFHYFSFTEDPDVQDYILACRNAYEVKQKCKGLQKDKNFLQKRFGLLEYCLQLKYDQCKEFRDILNQSGDIPLVEWAEWGDVEYGCCKCYDADQEWLIGQNACGRMMMKVRADNRKGNFK